MRSEFRPLLQLAIPVILAELGWMLMGVIDTIMVGRLGAEAIGAVAIGSIIFNTVGLISIGLLLGLDTLISQAFGATPIRKSARNCVFAIPNTPGRKTRGTRRRNAGRIVAKVYRLRLSVRTTLRAC